MAKKKQKLFHYSDSGFGHITACYIKIPEFGSTKRGPDWGGALTDNVNCKACLLGVLYRAQRDIERATENLRKLLLDK